MEILGPDAAAMLSAPISAPIVEEIAKALGVTLIFRLLRAEFDNMRDGIVYGALVGLGFNWLRRRCMLRRATPSTELRRSAYSLVTVTHSSD